MIGSARRRPLPPVALLLALGLTTGHGRAESGSSAAAEALYDQAKALMAAGKASEACPKLEESQRLDPGSGTLINLALCYEKTGRIASAWTTYREAATAARAAGNADRERGARERAAALAPKVSKLTIEVPVDARIAGLVVTRDGVEVGSAQWGVPIPTDAGTHELSAKAPGYLDWRETTTVPEKGAATSVTVPKLVAAPDAAPVAPVAVAASEPKPAEPAPAPAPDEPRSSGLGPQRIGALVVGGVGVAGLAVGGIFGVQAFSKAEKAKETCDGSECTSQAGVTAGQEGYSAATVSTIAMIAGGVCVAAGAVLWFTAPSKSGTTEVGIGPSGVVLTRAF